MKETPRLFALPYPRVLFPFRRCLDRWHWGDLGTFISRSRRIHTWIRDDEAVGLAHVSYALREGSTIVVVGGFVGGSTVLVAGARKLRGSGMCHVVDAFDASGDSFSAPIYRQIAATFPAGLRAAFDANVSRCGLAEWVTVHQGRAEGVAAAWSQPIDFLLLCADQSVPGARLLYEAWRPFLKPGGLIAIGNAADRSYAPDHDGNRRVLETEIRPPQYSEPWFIESTALAIKLHS